MKLLMTEVQYKVIKKPEFPSISLIEISGQRNLIASLKVFGPGYFYNNIQKMKGPYSHPETGETISLRAPTTAESILIASHNFEKVTKPEVFYYSWFQTGRIVETPEGIFLNPPTESDGNVITNRHILERYLNGTEPIKLKKGKIWIVQDREKLRDFGFADYDSFEKGIQSGKDFAEGGLARVLEHTRRTAETLRRMASFYKEVNVFPFNKVDKNKLGIMKMGSGRYAQEGQLLISIGDDSWDDRLDDGDNNCIAFGVLD
jgi:hypothetical protein